MTRSKPDFSLENACRRPWSWHSRRQILCVGCRSLCIRTRRSPFSERETVRVALLQNLASEANCLRQQAPCSKRVNRSLWEESKQMPPRYITHCCQETASLLGGRLISFAWKTETKERLHLFSLPTQASAHSLLPNTCGKVKFEIRLKTIGAPQSISKVQNASGGTKTRAGQSSFRRPAPFSLSLRVCAYLWKQSSLETQPGKVAFPHQRREL